jgi:hypothetical protein
VIGRVGLEVEQRIAPADEVVAQPPRPGCAERFRVGAGSSPSTVWARFCFDARLLGDVKWELDGDPVDAGDDVLATYRVHGRGRGSGVAVDQRITLLWSVRNGKVTRVRAYRERRTPLKLPGFGTS